MQNTDIIKILENSENHLTLLHNALEVLREENAHLKAENETWKRISDSKDNLEMSAVAKELNYPGIGRNKLFTILRDLKILRYNNEPYQEYMDRKYFVIIEQEVSAGEYGTIVNRKTHVTHAGIDYIRKTLDKYIVV